jgi:hypothetical protein
MHVLLHQKLEINKEKGKNIYKIKKKKKKKKLFIKGSRE